MAARIWYTRLLTQCFNGMTIDDVPVRYREQVRAYADADLEAGILPKYQWNLMMGYGLIYEGIVDEGEVI